MPTFKPRSGQTPSKATLAKLSGTTYKAGDLSSRHTVAPDGGAIADYPKGWRFLPKDVTPHQLEIMKNNPKISYHLERLHNLGGVRTDASGSAEYHREQIATFHYDLVIAPQIKAQKEAIARKEEEEKHAITTLRMRVQELTKKSVSKPTTPAVISSLPIIPIIIVAVIVGIFLLRRRA